MPRRLLAAGRGHRLSRGPDRATPEASNADFQLSPRDCGPLRSPTCALFDRDRRRARSTLSRDFSALTKEPGRAPCAPCFSTICERSPLSRREATGGLVDREGGTRVIFDIDGTREAAPQSLLPIPS